MRRLACAAAVVVLLIAMADTAGADEHLPAFTGPVVDAADVLAPATEKQVGAELTDYQSRSGNQLAVAVVKTTGSQSIEDYGIDLARSWGVGQKGEDNGILLLIAYDDRTVRVEVGRGLDGDLTDLQSGRIIRERLVPLLQKGDIDEAVVQGTRAIRTDLGDAEVATLPPALGTAERDTTTTSRRWFYPVALLGFAALSLLRRRNRGGRGHGRGQGRGRGSELGDGLVWGAALAALGGHGGRGGGFGGGGGDFGGGGASGDW